MTVLKRVFHVITFFCIILLVLLIAEGAGVNFIGQLIFTPLGLFMLLLGIIIEYEFTRL